MNVLDAGPFFINVLDNDPPDISDLDHPSEIGCGRIFNITFRVLENSDDMEVKPFGGWVTLFILPGHRFGLVDSLITNFHLPRSTLLMLVSAFAGKELIDKAYQEAIGQRYRFYSFGDAMLIL